MQDFSQYHYKHSLSTALEIGYRFFRFNEYDQISSSRLSVVMRHDIDHSLELALETAKIEKSLDTYSTFFIRTRAVKYNLLSKPSIDILKQIYEMGHEIGLHYESFIHGINKNDDITHHLKILSEAAGTTITSISPHEPVRNNSLTFKTSDLENTGIKHQAYEDKFFKEMKYISDSSARWREGPMIDFIKQKIDRLYILTHPFWWYKECPSNNY